MDQKHVLLHHSVGSTACPKTNFPCQLPPEVALKSSDPVRVVWSYSGGKMESGRDSSLNLEASKSSETK
jgi:hypothetical protein